MIQLKLFIKENENENNVKALRAGHERERALVFAQRSNAVLVFRDY